MAFLIVSFPRNLSFSCRGLNNFPLPPGSCTYLTVRTPTPTQGVPKDGLRPKASPCPVPGMLGCQDTYCTAYHSLSLMHGRKSTPQRGEEKANFYTCSTPKDRGRGYTHKCGYGRRVNTVRRVSTFSLFYVYFLLCFFCTK